MQRNLSLTPVITASTYLGMVSIGAINGSYGAALEVLRNTYGVGDAQLGLLGTAQTVGGLIGNLSSGLLERSLNAGARLCVGGLVFALGAIWFALSTQFPFAILALFVMGLGMGLFQINFSKLYSRGFGIRSGAVMTVMSSAFAVGSIAGPVMAALLGSNYRVLPLAFGVFSAVLAVTLLPARETSHAAPSLSSHPVKLEGTAWLFGLMVFFYVMAEQGASFWGVAHLESLGVIPDAAALVMSLFWTALLIGRFAGAALSLRFPSRTMMLGSAAGATLCLAAAHVAALASPAYIAAGLCLAAMFPTGLVWLARFNPSSHAITLYFVAGSIGAAIGLPLIGWLKNLLGAGAIPSALTVSSGLCLLLVYLIGSRQPSRRRRNPSQTRISDMNRFLNVLEIPADAVLLDARPASAYDAGHIAGSRHAEFTEKFLIRTPAQLEVFNNAVQTLVRAAGLNAGQRLVVYDAGRDSRATRLAWALEYAGFEVAVLREGLNGFTAQLEIAPTVFTPSDFVLESPHAEILATVEDVLHRDAKTIVIDARAADEFSGEKAVSGSTKGGHIPGAIHLDWQRLATATGIADTATLEAQLSQIPKDADVIVHCQSGARSSVVYHALKSVGVQRVRNYLGSMNEWVSDDALPLEQGS